MQIPLPRLTDGRRAGLLAAVAVYPLTRIAGTIPRPALDRAIVSGAGMAVAYVAATSTTNVVRDLVGASTEQQRDRRTAALTDTLGYRLPEAIRPRHPVVVILGEIGVGVALAAASRHPLFLRSFTLPPQEGSPPTRVEFQWGASLPLAAARAAGVAAVTLGVVALEGHTVAWIAREMTGEDDPGDLAQMMGHALIGLGIAAVAVAGVSFYSSRVAVEAPCFRSARSPATWPPTRPRWSRRSSGSAASPRAPSCCRRRPATVTSPTSTPRPSSC